MPVTSVGTTSFSPSQAAPAADAAPPASAPPAETPAAEAPAAEAPAAAEKPAADVVGHGVTRLKEWSGGLGINAPFIPGTPPPRGETAGAHGAHRGRISIR